MGARPEGFAAWLRLRGGLAGWGFERQATVLTLELRKCGSLGDVKPLGVRGPVPGNAGMGSVHE